MLASIERLDTASNNDLEMRVENMKCRAFLSWQQKKTEITRCGAHPRMPLLGADWVIKR